MVDNIVYCLSYLLLSGVPNAIIAIIKFDISYFCFCVFDGMNNCSITLCLAFSDKDNECLVKLRGFSSTLLRVFMASNSRFNSINKLTRDIPKIEFM